MPRRYNRNAIAIERDFQETQRAVAHAKAYRNNLMNTVAPLYAFAAAMTMAPLVEAGMTAYQGTGMFYDAAMTSSVGMDGAAVYNVFNLGMQRAGYEFVKRAGYYTLLHPGVRKNGWKIYRELIYHSKRYDYSKGIGTFIYEKTLKSPSRAHLSFSGNACVIFILEAGK